MLRLGDTRVDPFNTLSAKIVSIFSIKRNRYCHECDTTSLVYHGTNRENINSILNDGFRYNAHLHKIRQNKYDCQRKYDIDGVRFSPIEPGFYFTQMIFKAAKFSRAISSRRTVLACRIDRSNLRTLADTESGEDFDPQVHHGAVRYGTYDHRLRKRDGPNRAYRYDELIMCDNKYIQPVYIIEIILSRLA